MTHIVQPIKYTESQMMNWLIQSKAEILRVPNMKWMELNGNIFYSDFILRSHDTQWPAFDNLVDAIQFAMNFRRETID